LGTVKMIMVDDHPLVKEGIEAVVNLESDLELNGYAANAEDAIELIREQMPHIALIDLRLQNDQHGLDIIREARKMNSTTRYIILTSFATEEEIKKAMEEKVEGYILKEALPEELLLAIRAVSRGRKFYDPAVVQYALEQPQAVQKSTLEKLTPREIDVLRLLGRGCNNRAIAEELVISEHTVKKHVGQILEKLHLQDRTQAALYSVSLKKYLDK